DDGAQSELARRERDPLGMVAGAGGDDAAGALVGRQVRDLVVGAAQLEAEDRLQVLALEEDRVAETARQAGRGVERRLARDVVDPAREDVVEKRGERRVHAKTGPTCTSAPCDRVYLNSFPGCGCGRGTTGNSARRACPSSRSAGCRSSSA